MKKVLLIDDDRTNAQIVKYYLDKTGGFQTVWAQNAMEALMACQEPFDVILLDIMLPDVDGVELCGRLRQRVYCPIIFISCIDDEEVVIKALETGGDDYLVKPFSNKVLAARINANLRRVEMEKRQKHRSIIDMPCFTLDVNEHTLKAQNRLYHLSSIEFGVLMYLINNPYRTVSLDEIYEAVWNAPSYGDVRTVISHMYNLRKKLEANPQKPRFLLSVRGYGYYFSPDGEDASKAGKTE